MAAYQRIVMVGGGAAGLVSNLADPG